MLNNPLGAIPAHFSQSGTNVLGLSCGARPARINGREGAISESWLKGVMLPITHLHVVQPGPSVTFVVVKGSSVSRA